MTRVFQKYSAILAVLMCLPFADAGAQSTNSFPEMPVDARTARVQEQAEEVFLRTDYERAFFIYRNELVPIGDKYGQYMVGFMYLTGKGVDEDIVAASAWYRLAAERGIHQFEHVRDQVMAKLDDDQRVRSDALFVEFRQEYGDLALLTKAIREDYDKLRGRTGSRVAADSSPVTVVEMRSGATRSGSDYYGQIERRIRARLEYIQKHTDIEIIDMNVESVDIDSLEQQVIAHLGEVN